ncbi:MAG: hypothetical protein AB1611_03075 [bacterium]
MKRAFVMVLCAGALFLLGAGDNPVFAHGARYTTDLARAMVIRVEYDNGEPISYAEVKIFSPDDQKIEYQKGRTDKKGQFFFLPETGGEWKVVVSDGMGHGVVAHVSPDTMATTGLAVQSSSMQKWQKVIMALCVVWGFIGLALFQQARMMRRQ